MTRHARNCTAGAVYTYKEKKRDAAESGYGTKEQRLGKDSVKSFDCCCLTLQPCRNPVVTKDGYLFDKEAILNYILKKKKENCRKLKEYERMKNSRDAKVLEKLSQEQQIFLNKFMKDEKPVSAKSKDDLPGTSASTSSSESSISNMSNGHEKKLPSFWLPSECPNAGEAELKKPDLSINCIMSGRPIKMKDLIDVKFTPIKDGDNKKSLIAKEVRYMCPVTHDALSNAVPCAVLRPTGDVVTMECVEKLIKKDMIHPLTSQKLTEKDIIPLQRGGTGYSTTNTNLEGKEERPMMHA